MHKVNFRNREKVTKIKTQGPEKNNRNQYVRTYALSYSDDGDIIKHYKNEGGGKVYVLIY